MAHLVLGVAGSWTLLRVTEQARQARDACSPQEARPLCVSLVLSRVLLNAGMTPAWLWRAAQTRGRTLASGPQGLSGPHAPAP